MDAASHHVLRTKDWIAHYRRTTRNEERPESHPQASDVASILLFHIRQGHGHHASRFLAGWRDWYAYQIVEDVLHYARVTKGLRTETSCADGEFVETLTGIGPLAAAVSFHKAPMETSWELVRKLGDACCKSDVLDIPNHYIESDEGKIEDGLRRAAAIALSLRLDQDALHIALRIPDERPTLHSFRPFPYTIFSFVFRVALLAAIHGRTIREKDLLPEDLVSVCSSIEDDVSGRDFCRRTVQLLETRWQDPNGDSQSERISQSWNHDALRSAERFLTHTLEPLLRLANAVSDVLRAPPNDIDQVFVALLDVWKDLMQRENEYDGEQARRLVQYISIETAIVLIGTRRGIRVASVERLLKLLSTWSVPSQQHVKIVEMLARRPDLHPHAGSQAQSVYATIEAESDVMYRANLCAALARALIPASVDEASEYFRRGLDQLDAVGSDDYGFIAGLLSFAAESDCGEIGEAAFHTLMNVCELNIPQDSEKFGWWRFARAMSRIAGSRVLARLSRWDDRSLVELKYTLLPFLGALVDVGKLNPSDAVALNHLADPVDYYDYGAVEFIRSICTSRGYNRQVASEMIEQFALDCCVSSRDDALKEFAERATDTFGPSAEVTKYLIAACRQSAAAANLRGDREVNRRFDNAGRKMHTKQDEQALQQQLHDIASRTDPTNEESLASAISASDHLGHRGSATPDILEMLRSRVGFGDRSRYIHAVCSLDCLNLLRKLDELRATKAAWSQSSAALIHVYGELARPLLERHADELIEHGHLSQWEIGELFALTCVPKAELALALTEVLCRNSRSVGGSVWLNLVSLIAPRAGKGRPQEALERLLASETAELADSVSDGPWQAGLYPEIDATTIASGLIWRFLGSAYAAERWRAAHSLCAFARFGRWEVVDRIARLLDAKDAGPFQAGELPFYHQHAKLWLLIALSRLAVDFPDKIATFKDRLLPIAKEVRYPHILMVHFASKALLSCVEAGEITKDGATAAFLRTADRSPYPILRTIVPGRRDAYHGQPEDAATQESRFALDYDFRKYDVDQLAGAFGRDCLQVADLVARIARETDSAVTSMYEPSGRQVPPEAHFGMITGYHTHGQQLGWHALMRAAGHLLRDTPVVEQPWSESGDPWVMWLARYVLTRHDGRWLSDVRDRTPVDTFVVLRDQQGDLVGDSHDELLKLAWIERGCVKDEIVIDALWRSVDGVQVAVSSALVKSSRACVLFNELSLEEPSQVWLPRLTLDDCEREHCLHEKDQFIPWVAHRESDAKLDSGDPYGLVCADERPRLARKYAALCALKCSDAIGRKWRDEVGNVIVRAQTWGRKGEADGGETNSGTRLVCATQYLRKVLKAHNAELLMVVQLRLFRQQHTGENAWTWRTLAVRINGSMAVEVRGIPGRGMTMRSHRSYSKTNSE